MMPEISIILPVYNSERYLEYTLASILCQSMTDFEVIAVDDCSTDNSLRLLYEWAERDDRIRVIANEKNMNVAAVRNKGIAQANGKYICFIDSDDIWYSNKLERQLALMKQIDCDFCCTEYEMIDSEENFIKNHMINKKEIILKDLLKENYIGCSTVMLKAEVAKHYSMKGDFAHEDYVYWLELLQDGFKGSVLNERLVQYRVSQSGRSADKRKAAYGRWQIYRKHLKFGVIKSAWYFFHYAINGVKKYL